MNKNILATIIFLSLFLIVSYFVFIKSISKNKEIVTGHQQEKRNKDVSDQKKVEEKVQIDTSNWQTYNNDLFNFQFRYPNDENLVRIYSSIESNAKKYDEFETVHEAAYLHCSDQLVPDRGQIFVVDDVKTFEILQEKFDVEINIDNVNKKKITIGHMNDVIMYHGKHDYGEQYVYFFKIDNQFFIIDFNEPGCNHDIMEKIIETFQLK